MKEGRPFEVDTPNKCTICYQHYTSPMELMKHMLSHNSSESHAPTMPAKNDECNICVEIKKNKARPMRKCQYCMMVVCDLSCSKQDPNLSKGEMKRVHQKGKGCQAENPPEEMKVNCPK